MGIDRRVLYTKMVIREALDKLLARNLLEQITVKEICAEANINRATFYRNYEDIYDLFGSVEKEMIAKAFPNGLTYENRDMLLVVIYENQAFYKEFFRSRTETPYIKQTIEEMGGLMHELVKNRPVFNEASFHLTFQFLLYGILGILKDWVNGGCKEPPEKFGKAMFEIVDRQF